MAVGAQATGRTFHAGVVALTVVLQALRLLARASTFRHVGFNSLE